MTISYDGTDYFGWQWQPGMVTVEGVLRETFLRVFSQENVFILGASRTDAGVHASGQVVLVETQLNLIPEKMQWVFNNALPADIIINSIEKVDEQFHPHAHVKHKVYQYTFFTQRPDPLTQRFGWYYPFKFDHTKLARTLSMFVGTHDFRGFCKEEEERDTVRTIESITLTHCQKTGAYTIKIVGHSFLRYMVRRIVGASLTIASKPQMSETDIKRVFAEKKALHGLVCADPKGLSLKHIEYFN